MLYSYLNLESTKTKLALFKRAEELYSYLNLESTKTKTKFHNTTRRLYSYLNLESTKTILIVFNLELGCTVT